MANPFHDTEGLLADAGDASVLVHDGGRVTQKCLPQLLGYRASLHDSVEPGVASDMPTLPISFAIPDSHNPSGKLDIC